MSSHILKVTSHHMCSKCLPPGQTLMPLANSTYYNGMTESGPLAVDAVFQFVGVRHFCIIDLLMKHSTQCCHPDWGPVALQ